MCRFRDQLDFKQLRCLKMEMMGTNPNLCKINYQLSQTQMTKQNNAKWLLQGVKITTLQYSVSCIHTMLPSISAAESGKRKLTKSFNFFKQSAGS